MKWNDMREPELSPQISFIFFKSYFEVIIRLDQFYAKDTLLPRAREE